MKFKRIRLSISKKLTLIYTAILLCILIGFTFLTFYSLSNYVLKENENILSSNADIITSYINNMDNIDSISLSNIKLSPNISFSIYSNKNVIYSSDSVLPPMRNHGDNRKGNFKNEAIEHSEGVISTNRIVNINGIPFNVVIYKNFDDIGAKKDALFKILVVTIVFGALISLISGSFLSKKLLKPIQDITSTAKEITSKSLDKRIVTNGADDELKDLADTINSMIERLEKDFEKQRRFVSDASHELRTPLSVIHGHVNLLNRWGKDNPEQLNSSLAVLKSETDNMNRLIESLLLLAKGDNNVFVIKKEEFFINNLLKEIVDETLLNHDDFLVSYDCDDSLKINADYNAIKQVLRILIDNSIKFSTSSKEINIDAKKKDSGVFISVKDKGIGIPKESLPYIFNRFYRVDESRTKSTGGTGLGLSIAKQIVESHSGKIFAESNGDGTKISVYIPM